MANPSDDGTILLEVICPENKHSGMIVVSKSATVAELKREACAELMLEEEQASFHF